MDLLNGLHPSRETVIVSQLSVSEKLADTTVPAEKVSNLARAIFDFFNIFIVQYSSIEQSFLNSQLEDAKIVQNNSSDTIRSLENSLTKLFEWVESSIERQSTITEDCAVVSLIYILNTFFKSFLEKVKKAQLQLDASRSDHQD